MLHESTQKLILKLHELTMSGAVAWKEGEGDSVILDTEGYRVELTHEPASMRLSRIGGRDLERADETDLCETPCDEHRTFADIVAEMALEGGRYARGAEQAISKIMVAAESGVLAQGLDEGLDEDIDDEPDLDLDDDLEPELIEIEAEPEDDDELELSVTPVNAEAVRLSAAVGDMAARIQSGEVQPTAAPEPEVAPVPEAPLPEAPVDTPDVANDVEQPKPRPLGAWPVFDTKPAGTLDDSPVEAEPPVAPAAVSGWPHTVATQESTTPPELPDANNEEQDSVSFDAPETRPLSAPLQTSQVVPPPPPIPTGAAPVQPPAPAPENTGVKPASSAPPVGTRPPPAPSPTARVTSLGLPVDRESEQLVRGIPEDIEARATQRSETDDADDADAPRDGGTIYKPWG